ncbi:hypothetical protein HPB49_020925 [Dermacentor silvarum]|uniref:Uncharacterized protein n=1 Tax=Dermacentor silvarum TaxID=543639 RepID=A0ACB8E339_DERSI|nr:hypothetical protein HPB49_020925 [Dermacentor silvarum]
MSTATHKLMALGISNTVSELIEATLTAQYERLSLTHAGRAVLQQVGISPTRAAPNYIDLTPEYRQNLRIPPIPKRMHPEHHAERRADRARQFEKRFSGRPDVTYTDASYHPSKPAMVAAALAPHRSWGNVQVHALARDLSCRAECRIHRPDSPDTTISHDSLLTTYTDILQYYRHGRCIYHPAHRDLTRREAVQWRKLQTGSFPHPLLYSKIFPQQITPRCKHCSAPATLIHMAWTSPSQQTNVGSSSVRWRPRNPKGSPPTSSKPAQPVLGLLLENGTTIGSDARKPEGFVRTSVRPQPKATSEAASTCYCCHGPRPCLLSRPLPVRGPMQQHMAATMREAHHYTLPRGCAGARFIEPARAPLRESPDPLFPGGHCGAHLEGKPSSAPVIVNHGDGCHMWAAATQDCAAYQRGFGHFLPEFTIASAPILCQCRRSSDFSTTMGESQGVSSFASARRCCRSRHKSLSRAAPAKTGEWEEKKDKYQL